MGFQVCCGEDLVCPRHRSDSICLDSAFARERIADYVVGLHWVLLLPV